MNYKETLRVAPAGLLFNIFVKDNHPVAYVYGNNWRQHHTSRENEFVFKLRNGRNRNGTCFTNTECNDMGGMVQGNCAAG